MYHLEVKKRSSKNKILSGAFTFFVISALLFLGPASALHLGLDGIRGSAYTEGEKISFLSTVNIESNELIQVNDLELKINGVTACTFDANGNELSACDGINVELVSNTATQGYGYGYGYFGNEGNGHYYGYGYGYGYGQQSGELVYNITIDTPHPFLFFSGGNTLQVITNTNTQALESEKETVLITPLMHGDGNFLMANDDVSLVLHGKYNSTAQTLAGLMYTVGNTTAGWAASGTYSALSPSSGTMEMRIYDITRTNDVGIIWSGNYSAGKWYLHPEGSSAYLQGHMFVAPQ